MIVEKLYFNMNFVILCLIIVTVVESYPMFYGKEDFQEQMLASKELEPTEIQNAMCNIVTDQITATANATITRQLRGVCHAKDVREQLRHIEVAFIREIHKVHRAIQAIAAQNSRKPVVFKYLQNRP